MILGIGTDIIEVARIKSSLDRLGNRFAEYVLRPEELAYCQTHREPAMSIAVRFAAKEAIAKAFGTGIGAEINWHDMEIRRKESGEPFAVLHGKGQELATARGVKNLFVSLSHTQNYATAMAVLEG